MDQQAVHDHERWESVVSTTRDSVGQRQAAMVSDHGLSGDVQYHWSMDDASIVWSRGGRDFVHGRITMLGSVDHVRQTWLWSWANDSLPQAVLGGINAVRQYGEEHVFPLLVWPSFRAEQTPVTQARVVAAGVLGAEGLWFEPGDEVDLHFAIHDLRRLLSATAAVPAVRPLYGARLLKDPGDVATAPRLHCRGTGLLIWHHDGRG
ncbi:DUF6882 domain-containing protein [Polymorphospora rubra]|uniref:DUF6882 domain-containing protein n=1 Tax=Polymorphospora rubra TaxID=338584 RepID=UPI001BB4268F|nr:DUF6882 domain-containing protein [Polymorphospora rubra]